jgi:hypothetical protein
VKILVIGSKGSTGQRYCRILRERGIDVVEYEIEDYLNQEPIPECDRAIIASPTATHYQFALMLQSIKIPYLCEKPAIDELKWLPLMNGKMVCNWAFVFSDRILKPGMCRVVYNYKNTGKEGFWLDTTQLHILSDGTGEIKNRKEDFHCFIDRLLVTKEMIEASYERMIVTWLNDPEKIWNIRDKNVYKLLMFVINQHEITECIERSKEEGII